MVFFHFSSISSESFVHTWISDGESFLALHTEASLETHVTYRVWHTCFPGNTRFVTEAVLVFISKCLLMRLKERNDHMRSWNS